MKTYFLCLANSKKYQERCIAGIELKKQDNSFLPILHEDGTSKWIRPVSKKLYGAIEVELVKDVELGHIIEIDDVEPYPSNYQPENVLFSTLTIVRKANLTIGTLDKCTDRNTLLFGNDKKTISMTDIAHINHSLVLIKVSSPFVYSILTYKEKLQFRMKFVHYDIEYNLPITDLDFIEVFRNNNKILQNYSAIYLTISLAVPLENEHYKLIAGILYL